MTYRIQLSTLNGIQNPENESELMIYGFFSQFNPQFERLAQTILLLIEPENVKKKIDVEKLQSLLIVINQDGVATVFFNHLRVEMVCKSRHNSIEAGQTFTIDDISSVETVHFDGLEIHKNESIIYLFRIVGRYGIFFDFKPSFGKERMFDVHEELAKCHSYLYFYNRIELPRSTWKNLKKAGWFPFIGLKQVTLKQLIDCVESAEDEANVLDEISSEFINGLDARVQLWTKKSFYDHKPFIAASLERFKAEDYISSINILFPRIEGILRSNFERSDERGEPDQSKLIKAATPSGDRNGSALLPQKFRSYLTDVYFQHFNKRNSGSLLSRHTISHGVAQIDCFTRKWALVGFLIVDQLFFLSED